MIVFFTLGRNKMTRDILYCTFRVYLNTDTTYANAEYLILNSRHLFVYAYDYFANVFLAQFTFITTA